MEKKEVGGGKKGLGKCQVWHGIIYSLFQAAVRVAQ